MADTPEPVAVSIMLGEGASPCEIAFSDGTSVTVTSAQAQAIIASVTAGEPCLKSSVAST
jgi:hypothetical protein